MIIFNIYDKIFLEDNQLQYLSGRDITDTSDSVFNKDEKGNLIERLDNRPHTPENANTEETYKEITQHLNHLHSTPKPKQDVDVTTPPPSPEICVYEDENIFNKNIQNEATKGMFINV